MSLNELEFANPEDIIVKCELNEDVNLRDNSFAIPASNTESYKCGEIFTINSFDYFLVCAYCGCSYSNTTDFGEHLRTSHQSDNESEILRAAFKPDPQVNLDDTEYDAIEANKRHGKSEKHPSKYVCKHCKKPYQYKSSFLRHKCNAETVKYKKPSSQRSPAKVLIRRSALKRKRDPYNPVAVKSEPVEPGNVEPVIDSIIDPDIYCEICNRQFKYKNVFRRHGMQHEVAPLALQKDPHYRKCLFCARTFDNNAEWFLHESKHPNTGSFLCRICNIKFKRMVDLKRHAKIHINHEPLACEHCGKKFLTHSYLKSHIARVHLQSKRFSCKVCNKAFFKKHLVVVHMRGHTGEQPYKCEKCGKSFRRAVTYKDHLISHSNIRSVKCPDCPRSFFTKKLLWGHSRCHLKERPHSCPTCGKKFNRKEACLSHMKLHSGTKEYVCNLCGKAFAQHAGLYMHKRKVHKQAVDADTNSNAISEANSNTTSEANSNAISEESGNATGDDKPNLRRSQRSIKSSESDVLKPNNSNAPKS